MLEQHEKANDLVSQSSARVQILTNGYVTIY